MLLAVFVFILAVVYYFIKYHRKIKYYEDKVKSFDGPTTLPLIGNLHYFLGSSKELVKRLISWLKVYKGSFRVWILNELLIVITKPEDIQILATKNLEKDSNYRFLSDLMGDGLITCSVAKWKRRRRIVDRAFNTTVWSNYFLNVFNKQNMQLIQRLNQEVKRGKHFDIWSYIISTSFGSICETAMGYKGEQNEDFIIASKDIYLEASKLACRRCYQPWLQPSILFQIYTYLKGYPDIFKQAQDLPRKIIKTKKKLISEQKRLNTDEQIESKTSKNLLKILLEVQEGNDNFTEAELADEMLTIIVAGTETNALVDSFTLLMLAIHPEIQEKVYEELYEIFGETDRQPTLEDLHQMKFLEQCLKETLRLYSTVPLIHRETDNEIPITDGKVIPSGARIVICTYAVHHDEKYYPDPEKWNPHNFDQDKLVTRHPYAFLPFGAGPRTCLGNKYAMLSMKAQLSTVLRHFKITTDVQMEDIELNYDFVIRSEHGYRMKLEYRAK